MVRGTVFNIQRFSLHDGPGIRTTVFFKGCNLRCMWCHNPESFKAESQLSFNRQNCTGCGGCVNACPQAIAPTNTAPACTLCGACAEACLNDAISIIGKAYTPGEVIDIVMKDKIYYRDSGGVTFSGGEATVQYEFLLELLKKSKENELHTCLETNGVVSREKLQGLCGYVDLFLLDFKHSDEQLHRKFTGASNRPVLESLRLLDELKQDIVLRCPIIPGINDTDAHFAFIKGLKETYPAIQNVELMPYHEYGVSKWENIGLEYGLKHVAAPSKELINEWNRSAGII